MFLAAAALVAIYISFGAGFRSDRIEVWRNVEGTEKGYQILQGLYAIASGGYLEPDLVKVCRNSDLFRNRITI